MHGGIIHLVVKGKHEGKMVKSANEPTIYNDRGRFKAVIDIATGERLVVRGGDFIEYGDTREGYIERLESIDIPKIEKRLAGMKRLLSDTKEHLDKVKKEKPGTYNPQRDMDLPNAINYGVY